MKKVFRTNKCYNGGKEHKFRPRYTEEEMKAKTLSAQRITAEEFRKLYVRYVYVHDICEWCGKIINK